MAIARFHTYEDLIGFLGENNIPHRADPDKRGVELPLPNAGAVYARWEPQLPYVQLIYPFLPEVPEARISEIESAVSRVNTTIQLPGFGIEYRTRAVFMRLCVWIYEDGIPASGFQRQVLAVLHNARDFAAAFRDVAAGAPGRNVLDLAMKHAKQA